MAVGTRTQHHLVICGDVRTHTHTHTHTHLGETYRAVEAPLGCAERGRKGPAGGAGSYTSHTTTRHAGVANPQYYHVRSCVTIRPWTLITLNYTRLGCPKVREPTRKATRLVCHADAVGRDARVCMHAFDVALASQIMSACMCAVQFGKFYE